MDLKRSAMIALYLTGKSNIEIFWQLNHWNVNKVLIHRTMKRYNVTGSVEQCYGGGYEDRGNWSCYGSKVEGKNSKKFEAECQ